MYNTTFASLSLLHKDQLIQMCVSEPLFQKSAVMWDFISLKALETACYTSYDPEITEDNKHLSLGTLA